MFLSEKDRIGGKADPPTTEEDWSLVSSSLNMTSVLTRRAHPPELSKDLEWQKRVDLVKIYLRGSYVVWRSKVDSKITDQEENDVFMVLIHLEQSERLKQTQV